MRISHSQDPRPHPAAILSDHPGEERFSLLFSPANFLNARLSIGCVSCVAFTESSAKERSKCLKTHPLDFIGGRLHELTSEDHDELVKRCEKLNAAASASKGQIWAKCRGFLLRCEQFRAPAQHGRTEMRSEFRQHIDAEARRLLYSGEATTWEIAKQKADEAFRCGAKNRKGEPCQCRPLPGKRRCKFHGGAVPPHTEETKAFLREKAAKQPRDAQNRMWVRRDG